ncbi:MAG: DUF1684 domain-containing protein [Lewinellaceae bacterium]|nr:DUF1684 domain-containing protein [Lewinellaceae bacterium]
MRTLPGITLLLVASWLLPYTVTGQNTYTAATQEWIQQREDALRSETGWLNLAGLLWLKPGINTVGSDPTNDVVFPKGAAFLGTFHLADEAVNFTAADGVSIQYEGIDISEKRLYPSGENGTPVVLAHQSLRWFIIRRGDRFGVRLRDLEHPAVKAFHGIDRYPPDTTWRVKARLIAATEEHKIPITNVLGMTSLETSPGYLIFDLQGKTYQLDVVWEADELFILFADETNGETTYASGRFLYAAAPGPDGYTVLDFNRAINPPCAFTKYATCPLPPQQNRLPLAVVAGEKNFGEH